MSTNSTFRRRSLVPRNDSVRLETKDENGNQTKTIIIRTFGGTCCGCCDIFVGIQLISAWNIFFALTFFAFAGVVIAGYNMPNDEDQMIWRVILGLFVIPGVIRLSYALIGMCFMVRKLKELIVLDEAYKRPDDYNDYEMHINTWNWLVLWTPISTDFLLGFGALIYLADISSTDDLFNEEYWEPTNDTAIDALKVILWSVTLFVPAVIDSFISLYFHTVFRGFIEETFKNRLFACNCTCCPAKCTVCHPPYC